MPVGVLWCQVILFTERRFRHIKCLDFSCCFWITTSLTFWWGRDGTNSFQSFQFSLFSIWYSKSETLEKFLLSWITSLQSPKLFSHWLVFQFVLCNKPLLKQFNNILYFLLDTDDPVLFVSDYNNKIIIIEKKIRHVSEE